MAPPYISDLLWNYIPTGTVRSSSSMLLTTPPTRLSSMGPRAWLELCLYIRTLLSTSPFWKIPSFAWQGSYALLMQKYVLEYIPHLSTRLIYIISWGNHKQRNQLRKSQTKVDKCGPWKKRGPKPPYARPLRLTQKPSKASAPSPEDLATRPKLQCLDLSDPAGGAGGAQCPPEAGPCAGHPAKPSDEDVGQIPAQRKSATRAGAGRFGALDRTSERGGGV